MKPLLGLLTILFLSSALGAGNDPVVLVIHGGIGEPAKLTPENEKKLRQTMEQALLIGFTAIRKNGSALEAVSTAIKTLEDSPLFNAGKGAVFTRDGKNELDAAIMDGGTKKAGAVAGVTTVKNPILLARAVMEKSPHVFLIAQGAEAFAKEIGLEIVSPDYFKTDQAWKELQDFLEAEKKKEKSAAIDFKKVHYGTVGAVALDSKGNLAAGTSTGGLTGKRSGRVGDSPVIGAGTFADNEGCGVSATGQGEFFIRIGVAHEINSRYRFQKVSLQNAVDSVVKNTLTKSGGYGGVISLNKKGEAAFAFNTPKEYPMYRGYITKSGRTTVLLAP